MKRFLIAATAFLTIFVAPAAMARPHDGPSRNDHGRRYSVERHDGYNSRGYGYGYNQHGGYRTYGHDGSWARNYGYKYHNRGYRDAPRRHGRDFNRHH